MFTSSSSSSPKQNSFQAEPRPTQYSTEYTESDAQALLGDYPPPPVDVERLVLPVALPQIATNYDASFLRAYNSELEKSGVLQEDWLKFIDGLNLAISSSPPLRVIDKAGMVIGFVPYHWAIIASITMQTTAQTASHIISKTLTDKYLKKANDTYFGPRGLRVRLMRTDAMKKFTETLIAVPPESRMKSLGKATFRTAKVVGLHLPITKTLINRFSDPAPRVDPGAPNDVSLRRLAEFTSPSSGPQLLLPVSTDVPPPKPPASLYDKTSELFIKLERSKAAKSDAKVVQKRRVLEALEGGGPMPTNVGDGINDVSRRDRRKIDRASRRDGRRAGRFGGSGYGGGYGNNHGGYGQGGYGAGGSGQGEYGYGQGAYDAYGMQAPGRRMQRVQRRMQTQVDISTRLEMLKTDGLIWLVLLNADQDSEIQGTELADNLSDEAIDDKTWKGVLQEEDDEDEEEAHELLEYQKERPDLVHGISGVGAFGTSGASSPKFR